MCGGALFAWGVADIDLKVYLEQTRQALKLSDLLVATCKSVTFGACVGVVSRVSRACEKAPRAPR